MSTLTEQTAGQRPAQAERLRMASFGALTMLIVQFVLGTAYNLYGTAPAQGKSVGMFSSPLLAIHVVLGILTIVAAAFLVFRAVQAKIGPAVLGASVAGLVAVLAAAGTGSAFTNNGASGASLAMALATAVAMLCYAANLVILGKQRG